MDWKNVRILYDTNENELDWNRIKNCVFNGTILLGIMGMSLNMMDAL